MSLVGLIVLLLIVGVIVGFVPMDGTIKRIIVAVVCLVVAIWLLDAFGLFNSGIRVK
jgi:hypothetical protein